MSTATKSLQAHSKPLANSKRQLRILQGGPFAKRALPTFEEMLHREQHSPLRPLPTQTLQINVGYVCNQVCNHCHVDAGPNRKEIMSKATMKTCLRFMHRLGIKTLDITGGAPEMNPHFRWLVSMARRIGIPHIIVRSNLTIIRAGKKFYDLPAFFKAQQVHVISSLPCYTKHNTDSQRGNGVFQKSIEALRYLNAVGYGQPNTSLLLDLVYNPTKDVLPGDQKTLEDDYKRVLQKEFDIVFNHLLTITNLPISRFLDFLLTKGSYETYMTTLVNAFNPMTIDKLMCRDGLSVGWDGYLYDCDFNQMLGLKVATRHPHIRDIDEQWLASRSIVTSQHCFGCTAGSGSSCQGSILA